MNLRETLAALVVEVRTTREDVAEIRAALPVLSKRLDALEHAHTRAKTALMLLYTGGGMVVSALAWLFTH